MKQSAFALLASSSLTIATWRFLQWRARKRAKSAADRVQGMIEPGPLINAEDKNVCENVVNSAIRRASQWISFQLSAEDGSVMIGQVGGVSVHKRPLLTLEPDYIMKPVQTDHRGMREIFLYEAVKTLTKNRSSQQYASLLTGVPYRKQYNNKQSSIVQWGAITNGITITDVCDTLAMFIAMKMNDPVVAEHERTIHQSWKVLKKEIETLRRLSTFIPSYYGVVGQRSPMSMPKGEMQAHKDAAATTNGGSSDGNMEEILKASLGMSLEAHLLLTDITAAFRRPCVMDIKMGTQTYEPECPEDKKSKEALKYPEQETFGFRIAGMRYYDPSHPQADKTGYRFFGKDYGRSLSTKDDLIDALRLFLSAGCAKKVNRQKVQTLPVLDESQEDNVETDLHSSSSNLEENMAAQETIRLKAASNIASELKPIAGFFEENKSLCFYASSLLLVFEGDVNAPNPDVATVKMIDFGRVRRDQNGDQGYRTGLKTLKSLLDTIRKEEKQRLQTLTMSLFPAAAGSHRPTTSLVELFEQT